MIVITKNLEYLGEILFPRKIPHVDEKLHAENYSLEEIVYEI